MRVLFMGTPDIAATCLSVLSKEHQVVGAVCQPDKPKGRNMQLQPPPVKVTATELGIPVFQPQTLKDGAFADTLAELSPDVIAVIAYGKILPPYVLEYPRFGCINVHASLLPRYRGAAPMQRAIMNGEKQTGVTIMRMDEGLDTGDMLLQEAFPIGETDNFEDIHDRTAAVGGRLLLSALAQLEAGTAVYTKQEDSKADYAAKIEKAECLLDFTRPAAELDCFVRGLSPIPLSFTYTEDGKLLKVICATVSAEKRRADAENGEVLALYDKGEGGILVACGEGVLCLHTVLPEGKRRMTAADWIHGGGVRVGAVLGRKA